LFAGEEYKKFTSQEDFTEYRENFVGDFTNSK
jgi:hypothetical protein